MTEIIVWDNGRVSASEKARYEKRLRASLPKNTTTEFLKVSLQLGAKRIVNANSSDKLQVASIRIALDNYSVAIFHHIDRPLWTIYELCPFHISPLEVIEREGLYCKDCEQYYSKLTPLALTLSATYEKTMPWGKEKAAQYASHLSLAESFMASRFEEMDKDPFKAIIMASELSDFILLLMKKFNR